MIIIRSLAVVEGASAGVGIGVGEGEGER